MRTIKRTLAVLALAAGLAASLTASNASTTGAPDPGQISGGLVATFAPPAERPDIVHRAIPYGRQRKQQMAQYSLRHYGKAQWRLNPRGIVEHFTATRSLQSVFNTFAANSPDPELGEYPGVCTHFVIDTDGTIYRLVPLGVRCRHAVGLNHRMLGIEHVALSDSEVMGNRRQRQASLKLTTWLMQRFGISVGDVIGHNESLRSRFHHELYGPWRCQTHGDFTTETMNRYRAKLTVRAERHGLDTTPPRWHPTRC